MEVLPEGQAYLDAVRFGRIDTDVAYFDPAGAAPKLATGQAPPAPPGIDGPDVGSMTNMVAVVAAVLLVAMLVLVFNFGGNIVLSAKEEAPNVARARRNQRSPGLVDSGPLTDLQTILSLPDRRLALILLARLALVRTVAANGVLLQDSWTARDALRHIPKKQEHLEALQRLVLAGEWAQFGNRDVSEEEFVSQLQNARPLLGGTAG
ncbi:hypothetical protein GCM10007315_05980 [Gemmobacter tilapiae]|uniref:DUF4129 domain-containing protein n=2 Tax=Neogemmobacter tilapiae TaxID=875041 RepID=A0A918TG41_9RHOB|nr:hypothetical protein GCM10007315_05980 [Gemmobacter tilapiae]